MKRTAGFLTLLRSNHFGHSANANLNFLAWPRPQPILKIRLPRAVSYQLSALSLAFSVQLRKSLETSSQNAKKSRRKNLILVLGLQIFTKAIEILHERPAQADRARLIEQHKLTRRCAK